MDGRRARDDGAAARDEAFRGKISAGTITFAEVVRLKHMQTLGDGDAELRALGERHYEDALEAFRSGRGGAHADVAVFAESGCGVYALPNGDFKWLAIGKAIAFDWSAAHNLLNRVDAVVEEATEWWGRDRDDAGAPPRADAARGLEQTAPSERSAGEPAGAPASLAQLRPHVERAYGYTTRILSAIDLESERRRRNDVDRDEPPSQRYEANLAVVEPQIARMERLLATAAQRSAQQRYSLGMLAGFVAVLVLCGALGAAFAIADLPAWYGIAFPAGAIGAVMSVLQRMTSGRLRLDVHAGREMLVVYGAVRPFVGGIFAMAVLALIASGVLAAIEVTGPPLPFYAGVGFLMGFSERVAQDMLAGASTQLTGRARGEDEPADETSGPVR